MENSNREIAIKISGVKKMYKLGQIGGGSLQYDLQSFWAKIRGKEDPNSIIGQEQRLKGSTFMALNGIDLTVYKGEALGIIGGNGAGKSTLLKLLSRVTGPTEGEIDLYGRVASMLEVGTGFNGEMTGRENVYLNGAILGMTKAEIDSKMDQIIEFSEVRDFIDTPVKRYSSGMYVKLAFSVAAHLDSEIMIMDEVLAVGDMSFQKKCLDKMRDAAKKEGRTVLYVSHNMNTIRQLCDRCVVLDKGKVIFEGQVEDGIDIYIGNKSVSPTYIDLEHYERKFPTLGGIRMISARIINKEGWHINVGETLRFELSIRAEKKMDNVKVRCRLSAADGTSISMLVSNSLLSCESDEVITIPFEANVSLLAPGRFYLTPVLYGVNDYGAFEVYDHTDCSIGFEVCSVLGFNENIPWNQNWWGSIRLPELVDLRKNEKKNFDCK